MTAAVELASLLSLEGRTAIVTGAGAGIGLHVVARLAEAGATVHAVDASADAIAAAHDTLGAHSKSTNWHQADVRDASHAAKICALAGRGLRILVNNAGIYPQKNLIDTDTSDWERLAAINVSGVLNFLVPSARLMIEIGRGGSIVNLASVAGLRASNGFAHYGATKAAIISLTRSSALELGHHDIRVNAIAPGGIVTPGYVAAAGDTTGADSARRPLKRLGDPDDIARAVLYLASDMSSYVTGATLVVDGGVTLP